jgi:hypothetical protein
MGAKRKKKILGKNIKKADQQNRKIKDTIFLFFFSLIRDREKGAPALPTRFSSSLSSLSLLSLQGAGALSL